MTMKTKVLDATEVAGAKRGLDARGRPGAKCVGAGARRAGRTLPALAAALLVFAAASPARAADAQGEVRAAMREAYERLRTGDYGAVYDALPSASQRRVARAQFVEALGRARGNFELTGLEIERVSVAGDLAAVDTVLYATLRRPIEAEGKIVSRQYMVREGGRWRVTTGDRSTVGPLLAANPAFARRFPATEPRIFFKRDGRWVSLDALQPPRRRRQ